MRDDLKTLTDFRSLFEDDHTDLLSALLLQLLEADGCAESSRASTDNTYINLLFCALNGGRIKRIGQSGHGRMYPTFLRPFYRPQ
jgi:hypothetical protein